MDMNEFAIRHLGYDCQCRRCGVPIHRSQYLRSVAGVCSLCEQIIELKHRKLMYQCSDLLIGPDGIIEVLWDEEA